MHSRDENETLTRVGPGTPAGELFRRYWIPVGVSQEVTDVPRSVRYLGEDLVLFRGEDGRPGLLGLRCPHRLASFEYGRVECGGIRCIYHGWLFDVAGRCLEMPGEPPESTFKDKVRHTAYPCRDHAGLVFTYMGPGAPPLLPNFEILVGEHLVRKASMDWPVHPCNWLQIVENDQDPVHASVLHSDVSFAQNSLFPNMPTRLEFDETEFGVVYTAYRPGRDADTLYVRRVNSLMPGILGFGGGKSPDDPDGPAFGGSLRWRVPVDDTHTAFFSVYAVPKDEMGDREPKTTDMGGIFAPRAVIERSLVADDWQPDRDARGAFILDATWKQDYVAIVGQGAIVDRSIERLGASDRGITLLRRMYLRAIRDVQEGREPKGVVRDPAKAAVVKLPRTNMTGKAGETFDPAYG